MSCRARSSSPAARSSCSSSRAPTRGGRREDAAAAGRIAFEAQAAKERALAEARADGTRALGEAKAAGEAASVAAYQDLPSAMLLALAAKDLAGSLPQIGTLVISPDMLASLLAKLASGAPPAARRRGVPVTLAPRVVLVHRRTELTELARAARHPRAGRVLPAHPRPADRGPGGPARSGDIGAHRRCRRDPARLAAGPGRTGRPAPVPVRPGRPRRRGRAGRPRRERCEVPGGPGRHRDRPGARAQPRGAGAAPAEGHGRPAVRRCRVGQLPRESRNCPWSRRSPTTARNSPR